MGVVTYKDILQRIKEVNGFWMKTCWIKEIKDKDVLKEKNNDTNNK